MFKSYIDNNKKDIIGSICDLITYPSISAESKNPHFPFGKPCSDVLKYFLTLASSLSFKTKNIDGYCGYAEFGEGEELIGIIGHLDVVPAKEEDWSYSAFIPTIEDNRIYGRGAIDDKGPVISSLYAMKAVFDYCKDNNIEINKRIRLIVGLNEEVDWKCIKYYKDHEEIPSISFSPDADFPCIYAEKSVLSISVCSKLMDNCSSIQIESIDCDNNAINVVPKFCSTILSIQNNLKMENIINSLKALINTYNYEIDIYKIDNSKIKLTSYGISSHSAHPELGINAISRLIIVLNDLFNSYKIDFPLFATFCKYIGEDYLGSSMNINFEDESGPLTLNTGNIHINENKLFIEFNLRIPINNTIDEIFSVFNTIFKDFTVDIIGKNEHLYLEKDNELVSSLCKIFNETCHTNFKPIAIGGATYARAFPNCVSFGMNFPGDEDMCHKVDEFVEIDKVMLSTNIYAKAIFYLLMK